MMYSDDEYTLLAGTRDAFEFRGMILPGDARYGILAMPKDGEMARELRLPFRFRGSCDEVVQSYSPLVIDLKWFTARPYPIESSLDLQRDASTPTAC